MAIEEIEPEHGMSIGTAEGSTGVSDVSGINVPAQVYSAVFGLIQHQVRSGGGVREATGTVCRPRANTAQGRISARDGSIAISRFDAHGCIRCGLTMDRAQIRSSAPACSCPRQRRD